MLDASLQNELIKEMGQLPYDLQRKVVEYAQSLKTQISLGTDIGSDSTLQRIRKARMAISAQCDHDPKKLIEHYMELQERHHDQLVSEPKTPTRDILLEPSKKIDAQ
jgi:hypothetical protein